MKNNRQALFEANNALSQAQSLMDKVQAAITGPEPKKEDVYNLLNVIEEKLAVALVFLNKNEVSLKKGGVMVKEHLPAQVVNKLLGGKDIRIAIAEHPITKEMAACVPIMDYAEAFSYPKQALFQMIDRSFWLKRYSVVNVMLTGDGKYYQTRCIFEEAALGVFMKLQPKRCKDPEVAARVDQLQEELILLLRDTLKGYRTTSAGYRSEDGKLPHPGLSMDAISELCREADRNLRGKVSLRALNYFTGMPVDDLVEELQTLTMGSSALAGSIVQYLFALLSGEPAKFGIEKGATEEGTEYLQGTTTSFFNAFTVIGREQKLPKFFRSVTQLGQILGRETEELAFLGWKRTLHKAVQGERFYRYEFIKTAMH